MLSPAARHRQKILARQAAAKAPEGVAAARPKDGPEASAYELLLAELGKDLARLREVQSVEGKIALKREMIVSYDHHVDATLDASAQSGKAVQDEIVATMMIWRFDIGDFAAGLEIAAHVLRFGLAMPQRMQRQAATLIAEEVAEAALAMDRDGMNFRSPSSTRPTRSPPSMTCPTRCGRSCSRRAGARCAGPMPALSSTPRARPLAAGNRPSLRRLPPSAARCSSIRNAASKRISSS